eukprot:746239-Hanusia_phi.AAC.13
MHKYRAVREKIRQADQTAAVGDADTSGQANRTNIGLSSLALLSPLTVLVVFQPSPIARTDDIRTTHCPQYLRRFLCNMLTGMTCGCEPCSLLSDKENRNIGFPWSPQGVKRTLSSVGGTVAAMHSVCGRGAASAWSPPNPYSPLHPHMLLQSGVDCLAGDKLGRAKLSLDGVRNRCFHLQCDAEEAPGEGRAGVQDRVGYHLLTPCPAVSGLSDNRVKLVVTMGGGYPKDMSTDSQEFR